MSEQDYQNLRRIIAWVILFLPLIDWSAVYILRKIAKASSGIAIKERLTVAIFIAIAVSINALLAIVVLLGITLPPGVGLGIIAISLILISAPNLYWLYLYSQKKFKK